MVSNGSAKRCRGESCQRGVTLVELIVVLAIMGVVTAMIIGTWFALQNAYSSTTIATEQREAAQQGMARMVQEIRDTSGAVGSVAGQGFVEAGPTALVCYSAFNAPSAGSVTTDGTGDGEDSSGMGYRPPMGGFYYIWDGATHSGTVFRWREADNVPGQTSGDRVDVLIDHVVNGADDTPVFVYTCLNTGHGDAPEGTLLGAPYRTSDPADLATITSVQITLRVDLNFGHAPNYMDLISTAQPRNNRQT